MDSDPEKVYPVLNREGGLQGLTNAEVEKRLGIQVRMMMPFMGDNFTVANNRYESVFIKSPTDSSALLMEQLSRQIIEMSLRA